jgi:opacity protein-like surface antigen
MKPPRLLPVVLVAIAVTAPGLADTGTAAVGTEIGWRGWGPRIGVTDDPDQIVGGVHFDLGEFVPRLRFQPDVQLGFGDDATTLFATVPVHYRFNVNRDFTPYVGGGIAFGFVDRDLPPTSNGDDTEFEAGFRTTGGLDWSLRSGRSFLVELSLGFGDVQDVQIVAGWTF